jgi:hypothetical protein
MTQTYEEKVKEQNKMRQRKFYAANKERIKDKKKQDRADLKAFRSGDKVQSSPPPEPESPVHQPAVVEQSRSTKILYNQDVIMKMIQNSTTLSDETKERYRKEVKALFRVTKCDDLLKCLSNFKKIKKELETSKMIIDPTKTYSVNTIKKFIEGVLVIIDKIGVPVKNDIANQYRELLEIYKLNSTAKREAEQAAKEAGAGAIVFIDTILEKVEEKFGKNSKQYLVTSFYKDAPMRDNMGGLIVIPSIRQNDNSKTNYAVVPRKGDCILVFNQYKTDKRYGQLKFTLNKQTSELLRNYINKHGVTYDNKLFPEYSKGKMSSFIGGYLKKCGFEDGNINYIRHSVATEDFDKHNLTPEEKVRLSRKMAHSVVCSYHYIRKIVGAV